MYKNGSYIVQGCATDDGYICYILNADGTFVLSQTRTGDSYGTMISLQADLSAYRQAINSWKRSL